MKLSPILAILLALISLSLPACDTHVEELHKIVATSPQLKAVTLTEQYVCQIHAQRQIKVRALEMGYLEEIAVKDGQQLKEGDLMFKIPPVLLTATLDAELAEVKLAKAQVAVARQAELELAEARLASAQAKADLASAELNLGTLKAPFDGIVDGLQYKLGSKIQKRAVLATFSDNSVMRVYFNVPEARYLEYMADLKQHKEDLKIELMLANGRKFDQIGKIGGFEANFNTETGNIPFRVDFPNPDRLLRHGQIGNVLIRRVQKDAIVIPQRATFEILNNRYVYVVDKENVVHQREIFIQNELEDIFVIKKGVGVNDKIVLEGTGQIRDGEKVEYEAN